MDGATTENPGCGYATGSMGSTVAFFHVPPQMIPDMVEKHDWSAHARRVFLDPFTGLIALMSPSRRHETHTDGVRDLVKTVGDICGFRAASLGSTMWRAPDYGGAAEPDACFWLRETALAWDRAALEGPRAEDAFEKANPPDLVVEVERTHGDENKPALYQALGVPEMWRVDVDRDNNLAVEVLELPAEGGPAPMDASAQLPLCTRAFVVEALPPAARGWRDELRALVERAAARLEAAPAP